MGTMSMNKAIHGAVRRDLDRFARILTDFPDGDRGLATRVNVAWANFDDQLTHHHEGEHEIAWPHLIAMGVDPSLLASMDAEHAVMSDALVTARAAVGKLATTGRRTDADAAREAVVQLREAAVAHLDHEEAEFEELMLREREHPEMKAMGKKFGKVSPARGGRFFTWVMDGADADQQAAVTRDVPGPVLTVIGGVFGRGYRKSIAPLWAEHA
jgi:hypothetical protein